MPARDASGVLERLVRRDRLAMLVALTLVVLLAIVYLVRDAATMRAMADEAAMHARMGMVMPNEWGPAEWLGLFLMWAVMMVAMMLPSAAPVILLVLATLRRRGDGRALFAAYAFVAGYLLAWTTFSAIAAGIQWRLHRSSVLAMDMHLNAGAVSAAVLIAAGVFQWSPLKNSCLRHCRSPLDALSRYWREGIQGALLAGVRHGTYCVGCCWLIMLVLFVVGVMNLVWVAALACLILLEKVAPQGRLIGCVAGVALLGWGTWLLVKA